MSIVAPLAAAALTVVLSLCRHFSALTQRGLAPNDAAAIALKLQYGKSRLDSLQSCGNTCTMSHAQLCMHSFTCTLKRLHTTQHTAHTTFAHAVRPIVEMETLQQCISDARTSGHWQQTLALVQDLFSSPETLALSCMPPNAAVSKVAQLLTPAVGKINARDQLQTPCRCCMFD